MTHEQMNAESKKTDSDTRMSVELRDGTVLAYVFQNYQGWVGQSEDQYEANFDGPDEYTTFKPEQVKRVWHWHK